MLVDSLVRRTRHEKRNHKPIGSMNVCGDLVEPDLETAMLTIAATVGAKPVQS